MAAITDMVAPVVLITLSTLLANGLLTVAATLSQGVDALNRERLSILRGPRGDVLDLESVPPLDRERLAQIRAEMPVLTGRFRVIRHAILIIWVSIGLFMLGVFAIAAAVTVPSEGLAFTALALVIAGLGGVFTAIAAVTVQATRSAETVVGEINRTTQLLRRDVREVAEAPRVSHFSRISLSPAYSLFPACSCRFTRRLMSCRAGPRVGREVAGNEGGDVGAPSRRARTVILPATLGAVLGFLLSTVGFIGVAFGNGTMCTTYYETGNHCDSLNLWLEAGLIGQGVILAASLAVLFVGPMLPARRRLMVISGWGTVGLAVMWYAAYAIGARLSW